MDCFICRKHQDGPVGGFVAEDELIVVTHVVPEPDRAYLGHLVVEPRRHVAGLADLIADEAAALGHWATLGAKALKGAGAEHVYSAVIGHQVDHLHLHLIPRYPNTPREYWWLRLDEWPDAPMGTAADITRLVGELSASIGRIKFGGTRTS